jgi:hypothetical protein
MQSSTEKARRGTGMANQQSLNKNLEALAAKIRGVGNSLSERADLYEDSDLLNDGTDPARATRCANLPQRNRFRSSESLGDEETSLELLPVSRPMCGCTQCRSGGDQ